MNLDIQEVLQKVQAKLGELTMQVIMQELRAEKAETQLAEQEGADHSPEPELEEQ